MFQANLSPPATGNRLYQRTTGGNSNTTSDSNASSKPTWNGCSNGLILMTPS
ncbi:MAG: hypothetical protein AAFY26_19265 [Cyanobacteria bacterium J06638_22]